jgi:hypothetical protein
MIETTRLCAVVASFALGTAATFGGVTTAAGSGAEAQELDWATTGGGAISDRGLDIATDPRGSSYVTGFFQATATFGAGEANETMLSSAGFTNIFVAKYAPDGDVIWATSAGGSLTNPAISDQGFGIAVDLRGNSYVTGRFGGKATFGAGEANETVLSSVGESDVFVAKYASDGTLLWATSAGGPDLDLGFDIATDLRGNSYVTGRFGDTATFGAGEADEAVLMSVGESDVFVAKYAPDGDLKWATSAGGSDFDLGSGIATDFRRNSYVTGDFRNTATFGVGEAKKTVLSTRSSAFPDVFVAKYASDGTLLWARSAGGSDFDQGSDIATDLRGNSYVTGRFGDTATFGAGEADEAVLMSVGESDVFVAKYARDGDLIWARSAGGSDFDQGFGIAVDLRRNSYVTGLFRGTAMFGVGEANETELGSRGLEDVFVARYAPDDTLLWATSAGGSEEDVGTGVATSPLGNSYVTGAFFGTATFGAGEANEAELTSAGSFDIFVAKYRRQLGPGARVRLEAPRMLGFGHATGRPR